MFNKKKAFTLTELLIVVIVIGILSAVVLPKFNKVVETRKTTEAEEVMAAIRTEQEYRCSLNKPYTTDFTSFIESGDVKLARMPETASKAQSKNFTYQLTNAGVTAKSTDPNKDYTLEMPSFADGRISCTGDYCHQLNKDYPTSDALRARSDYMNPAESCVTVNCDGETTRGCTCSNGGTGGTQTRTCDTATGGWSDWSECTGCIYTCSGESTQACGCQNRGTQTRTCNTTSGTWSSWSACSEPDECTCTGDATRECTCSDGGTGGTQTRTCDTTTGTWGNWSECAGCTTPQCTTDVTEPCTPLGGAENCGTQTHYCNNGRWNGYSACRKTSLECCTEANRPDEPAQDADCLCSDGRHGHFNWGKAMGADGECQWSWACTGCTGSTHDCGPSPEGQTCCIAYDNCGCRTVTGPGGGGEIAPDFPPDFSYNAGGRVFSFYYTAASCPPGQEWRCDCSGWGTWRSCSCDGTGSGWNCTCRH